MNSSAVDPLEWYHILQNFPTSNIFDIEGGGHISTLLPPNLTFVIISGSNCHSNVLLVSKPMFSWSKNSMRLFLNL